MFSLRRRITCEQSRIWGEGWGGIGPWEGVGWHWALGGGRVAYFLNLM